MQDLERKPWFERNFNFNFPPEIFPSILERLSGTPARLEELVRSTPVEVRIVRANDAWSIHDHIGHLEDLDQLHEGRIDDYLAEAETMRAADLKNRKTWEAGHNNRKTEELLTAFRNTRKRFVERLEAVDVSVLSRKAVHPRLNVSMRLIDMAYFVAEHDDHHLASIRFIARTL
ncbi:MAG TPA: DinB family protein [Acidobacteriota bacterium]|nr:DinB family protein [Acidobacteriota bacterium]